MDGKMRISIVISLNDLMILTAYEWMAEPSPLSGYN
jgi:hypothetical protein